MEPSRSVIRSLREQGVSDVWDAVCNVVCVFYDDPDKGNVLKRVGPTIKFIFILQVLLEF